MEKIIMSKNEIAEVTKRIGNQLSIELNNETRIPIAVGVMKGSMNFMMDVVKNINADIFTDYIQVSSYNGTNTTGRVILKRDLSFDIKDRTVILIEDVIDTGISMNYLLDFLKERYRPKRIILVALFDKTYRRKIKINIDYVGKVLDTDDFLYGYGLDYCELGRNLPEVYGLNQDEVNMLSKKINSD